MVLELLNLMKGRGYILMTVEEESENGGESRENMGGEGGGKVHGG